MITAPEIHHRLLQPSIPPVRVRNVPGLILLLSCCKPGGDERLGLHFTAGKAGDIILGVTPLTLLRYPWVLICAMPFPLPWQPRREQLPTNLQEAAGVVLLDDLQAVLHQARGLAQLHRAVRDLVSHHLQWGKESSVARSCGVLGDGE